MSYKTREGKNEGKIIQPQKNEMYKRDKILKNVMTFSFLFH